ncbi:hypothetical protein [uncultured Devosia sp.]|uniref:hypothetical protein n=1 Tax=uncultured Devosia sp. TaxID=211434 RepID=UPI002616E64D|nr:hypothetical protein [uncultured Devosia sp.]
MSIGASWKAQAAAVIAVLDNAAIATDAIHFLAFIDVFLSLRGTMHPVGDNANACFALEAADISYESIFTTPSSPSPASTLWRAMHLAFRALYAVTCTIFAIDCYIRKTKKIA